MKRLLYVLLAIGGFIGICLFAQAHQSQPNSLGERTAENCKNGGLSICDWCKFKEAITCPGPMGHPEHAEQTAERSGRSNGSQYILPLVGLGVIAVLSFFIFSRGGKLATT